MDAEFQKSQQEFLRQMEAAKEFQRRAGELKEDGKRDRESKADLDLVP